MPYLPRFEGPRWLNRMPTRKARLLVSWSSGYKVTLTDPAGCSEYKFIATVWVGKLQLFRSFIFWNRKPNAWWVA